MNFNVVFFKLQATLACNLKRESTIALTCRHCFYYLGVQCASSEITGGFLPAYVPAVCGPEDLPGVLAPDTHHTGQCFADSESHGW